MSRTRLPTPKEFAALGVNQDAVLEWHRHQIEEEISGLQDGWIHPDHRGRAYYMKLARARLNRLFKLANDFGYWLDKDEAA